LIRIECNNFFIPHEKFFADIEISYTFAVPNLAFPRKTGQLRNLRELSSAGSEHLPYKQRVGGSNPSAPTSKPHFAMWLFLLADFLNRWEYLNIIPHVRTG
jgi:hypothetical protein